MPSSLTAEQISNMVPHELITLALADLEAIEKNPDTSIDMGQWISDPYEGVCRVCLAGSVLYCSLGHRDTDHDLIEDSPEFRWAPALDSLRMGCVASFFVELRLPFPTSEVFWNRVAQTPYTSYEDDPAAFKEWLSRIATFCRHNL